MPKFHTIPELVERRTYLKGKLRGKFIGFLDMSNSDLLHENFYDIQILEAEVRIEKDGLRKWFIGGEFEEFKHIPLFPTPLPATAIFHINLEDGLWEDHQLNIFDTKLSNIRLFDQLHEKDQVFGTIEGEIGGYIVHNDLVQIIVEEPPTQVGNSGTEIKPNIGKHERLGQDNPEEKVSFWKSIGDVFQYLLIAAFFIPLLFIGWPLLVIIAGGILLYLIASILQPIIRYSGRVFLSFIWLLFIALFIFSILEYFSHSQSVFTPRVSSKNEPIEKTVYEPTENEGVNDSIITHFRTWENYDGHKYSGNLKVRLSDYRNSESFRNYTIPVSDDLAGYNYLVDAFSAADQNKLSGVYPLFDSLRLIHKLNEKGFAEMIVSCIQDIPYTLILEDVCSPWQYNDAFIRDYLQKGGQCRPCVKYGILTPVEFVATLQGDCDTRALLLYTILNHYEFDVVMLSSSYYRHSVIAINLPYSGVSKVINGKKYVIWETTQAKIPPGLFPTQMSQMKFWSANLLSIKNTQQ